MYLFNEDGSALSLFCFVEKKIKSQRLLHHFKDYGLEISSHIRVTFIYSLRWFCNIFIYRYFYYGLSCIDAGRNW